MILGCGGNVFFRRDSVCVSLIGFIVDSRLFLGFLLKGMGKAVVGLGVVCRVVGDVLIGLGSEFIYGVSSF